MKTRNIILLSLGSLALGVGAYAMFKKPKIKYESYGRDANGFSWKGKIGSKNIDFQQKDNSIALDVVGDFGIGDMYSYRLTPIMKDKKARGVKITVEKGNKLVYTKEFNK